MTNQSLMGTDHLSIIISMNLRTPTSLAPYTTITDTNIHTDIISQFVPSDTPPRIMSTHYTFNHGLNYATCHKLKIISTSVQLNIHNSFYIHIKPKINFYFSHIMKLPRDLISKQFLKNSNPYYLEIAPGQN